METALGIHDSVPVRDSKAVDGPVLVFPNAAWTAFLRAACSDELH
ncbi:DUF397 domain-containing protein [Streptomyces sp. WMMC1477]|nr:DUF397 domain-containing protein [Streptomyces sp. WMMC1477]MCZ7433278.1 DUF397 domain-containing protein [Streptomyces sp. WMMC1477]